MNDYFLSEEKEKGDEIMERLDETSEVESENYDDLVVEEPAQASLREKLGEFGILEEEDIEEMLTMAEENGVAPDAVVEKVGALVSKFTADARSEVVRLENEHLLATSQRLHGNPSADAAAIKEKLTEAKQRLARLQESNAADDSAADQADTAAELLAGAQRMRGKGVLPIR